MNIPDSIAKLTTEVSNDHFNTKPVDPILNLNDVVLLIKKSLNLKQLNNFEQGLNFYKTNVTSDKSVSQNIMGLVSDIIITALKDSDINEEYKINLGLSVKNSFTGINEILESVFKNLNMLNKNNNLLDVKDFTLIILGYAIGLLKKIDNNRS
jgi:hypothetical protein